MSFLPAHKRRDQFEAEMQGRIPWLEPRDVHAPIEIFGYVQATVNVDYGGRYDGRRMIGGVTSIEAEVVFLGRLDRELVRITARWHGSDSVPPRGSWHSYDIVRSVDLDDETAVYEAMLRGQELQPRRVPRIVPEDVRADEAVFEAVVEELERS